ncbi:hypothetical protein PpBr36_01244 [Pyricularia pennisetigena]|uniref:hypothetical protein n=1 Tax=Pyricularia pennisetigena TaxID=1578925 RepID=UPI001150CBF2|nr:hypothetical protein PpBr36_01244 [Pyricularia pennisetigena]TLS29715.1 hypothetical protein PpBr36_01244 [Pyricularia pennisetigena]
MLLLHQIGSVKIGEVVRYTVTYTPSNDRILPSPECLHLRIRNSSSTALRAAFVHGPYTLCVAAYPSHYDPNKKFAHPRRYGVPEFEPMLKAGGSWACRLLVPDNIRQSAGSNVTKGYFGGSSTPTNPTSPGVPPGTDLETQPPGSVSWIIEVTSQVIFSTSAAVHYEILLARDEKSLHLGIPGVSVIGGSQVQLPQPGKISDFQPPPPPPSPSDEPSQNIQRPQKGVFSSAIFIKVEDTAALWDTPKLAVLDEPSKLKDKVVASTQQKSETTGTEITQSEASDTPSSDRATSSAAPADACHDESNRKKEPDRRQKVHLVVLTHGLHSNLGSDMLYLKESIDAGVKQAKIDAKQRRARESREKQERDKAKGKSQGETASNEDGGSASRRKNVSGVDTPAPLNQADKSHQTSAKAETSDASEDEVVEDDEEVVVRGFSGNATRTERGIKYLGKRLARYVLSMTYPDQPYLPASLANVASGGTAAHKHSSIRKEPKEDDLRAHRITKISFIGHSLGGLVQMYAIAYIQKHSPQFFTLIEPINFIALASPLLGLNHENPLYLKFALDFGLVGRTGQDLGLTWRAPTIARSGWSAIVSNLGENAHKKLLGETEESKPLLRILPTGPAHVALKAFRNRTLYSNVVNDGIVPLRTSCLLFLDWQGIGRVEKARREAGLVETVVGFGWSELMGANVTSPRSASWPVSTSEDEDDENDEKKPKKKEGKGEKGNSDLTVDPGGTGSPCEDGALTPLAHNSHEVPQPSGNAILEDDRQSIRSVPTTSWAGMTSGSMTAANPFTGFFNLFRNHEPPKPSPPNHKQTKILKRSQTLGKDGESTSSASSSTSRVTTGHELSHEGDDGMAAPPRTTLFEAAGDLLNPKLPSVEYLIDPSKRPRTIFHDRVYHPSDIPPPPLKKRPSSSSSRRKKGPARVDSAETGASASSKSPLSSPIASPTSHSRKGSLGSSTNDYDDTANTNPNKGSDEVIDSAGMRVEEKIARAYHRGLSWRKVLVKLEPDAHNNIIVRRKFANAFGWPVIQHLVEAHFSDSAVARKPDSAEAGTERAKDVGLNPDSHGRETKQQPETAQIDRSTHSATSGTDSDQRTTSKASAAHGGDRGKLDPGSVSAPDLDRTPSERREATDKVSELPNTPPRKSNSIPLMRQGSGSSSSSNGGTSPGSRKAGDESARPAYDRIDSMTWSDRDWADSDDDSELEIGATNGFLGQGLFRKGTLKNVASGSGDSGDIEGNSTAKAPGAGWNWTEKIVGKGPTRNRAMSPRTQALPPQSGSDSFETGSRAAAQTKVAQSNAGKPASATQ